MKVAISYSVDVSEDFRRAINLHYGRPGLATREEVRRWFQAYGESMNDDIMYALQESGEAKP